MLSFNLWQKSSYIGKWISPLALNEIKFRDVTFLIIK